MEYITDTFIRNTAIVKWARLVLLGNLYTGTGPKVQVIILGLTTDTQLNSYKYVEYFIEIDEKWQKLKKNTFLRCSIEQNIITK